MNPPVLELKDLTVEFPTRRGIVRAVNRVGLTLERGRRLGLVGESGSGKSMTLLTVLRLTPHPGMVTEGEIRYQGRNLLTLGREEMRSLRGKDISMIFQDPMTTLNPVYKVGDQIRESLKVHNMFERPSRFGRAKSRTEAEKKRVIELMGEVGIPAAEERFEAFPHEFSGGMQQRAVIAIALACNPNVLLADEPTTALDVTVQAQIMALLERINQERDTAMLLVTHDLSLAAEFCDRIAVMYAGRIVEQGSVDDVIDRPRHPYTVALINALPRLRFGRRPLQPIPGEVDLASLPPGCAFAPRCREATEACHRTVPTLECVAPGHHACCLRCE
jgi:oligopeptide/dipeptide ABC transporter ATP-binding protein